MDQYCDRWNEVTKAPFQAITIDQARDRHSQRRAYAVFVVSKRAIVHFSFQGAYCVVLFLDSRDRVDLSYGFVEIEGARLFLTQASHHTYEGEQDLVAAGETFNFSQSGHARKTSAKRGQPTIALESSTDVSGNFSPLPSFGEHAVLAERERPSPGD
jgi:hypothetical protein